MRVAVISDSHDNEKTVIAIIKEFNEKVKPDAIIHCGDMISPFILEALNKAKCNVYICFGYQDGGEAALSLFDKKGKNVQMFTRLGEIKEEKIVFTHTPIIAKALAKTGDYKAVFYGHTHEAKIEKLGNCWLINPGELMGREHSPSYAVYDTKLNKAEIIKFEK